jgi:hypothetical protein
MTQSDAEPNHASVEMARAKSYAKGFQDGLKAARKLTDAEPVAWRFTGFDGEWWAATPLKSTADYHREHGAIVEPLYTAPPRPDVSALKEKVDLFDNAVEAGRNAGWDMRIYTPKSLIETLDSELVRLYAIVEQRGVRPDTSAGLIEAAELAEKVAAEDSDAMARLTAHDIANRIRARAADRSGK